jgi:hypothetical protein
MMPFYLDAATSAKTLDGDGVLNKAFANGSLVTRMFMILLHLPRHGLNMTKNSHRKTCNWINALSKHGMTC